MRIFARLLLCVGLAVAVAGCSNADKHYFKEGIGANLYAESAIAISEDANSRTELQRQYVEDICKQAGLFTGDCGPGVTSPQVWSSFVQAGMNDIDQRCDAYLTWLDNVKRAQSPTLKEFGDAQSATTIIMREAGMGVAPIAIAAAAFGFATNTFTNVTARLVLEVDRSTVQTLVLSRQKKYREELFGTASNPTKVVIANRPAAIFALRSYLRLCMPMTIETEINTLIATFERGGVEALKKDGMISAKTVGVARRANKPITPEPPAKHPAGNPTTLIEKTMGQKQLAPIQKMLCDVAETGDFDRATRDGLVDLNTALFNKSFDGTIANGDRLADIEKARKVIPKCEGTGLSNSFEVGIFASFGNTEVRRRIRQAIEKHNKTLPQNEQIALPVGLAANPPGGKFADEALRTAVTNLMAFYQKKNPDKSLAGNEITAEFWQLVNNDVTRRRRR